MLVVLLFFLGQCSAASCPAGDYDNGGSCSACLPGYYCTGGTDPPTACSPGTSNSLSSRSDPTDCVACSPGHYAMGSGSSACTPCAAGKRCPSTTTDGIDCSTPGTYAVGGAITCTNCPAGSSCLNNFELPVTCRNGTYTDTDGQATCQPCPAGSSCPTSSGTPVPCAAGTSSPAQATACEPCACGQYSAAGEPTCSPCPPGHQCLDASVAPVMCAEGYFAPGYGSSNCSLCAAGTLSSTSRAACINCPAGFKCPDARAGALACSPGYWSTNGTTIECMVCPAGYRCPLASDPPDLCPLGTYATVASTACLDCPAGQECLDPAGTPTNCAAGNYSLLGEATCVPCTPGHSCASTATSPVPCAPGYYAITGGACTICPAGSACSNPASDPSTCAGGSYSLDGATACTQCPAGFQCPSTSSAPQACSPGSYALAGATTCVPCVAGESCVDPTVVAATCPPGTFSAGGAVNCTECPPGSACPTGDIAARVTCVAGEYSTGGATGCTPCPAGSACPATDADLEQPCASGYFSTGSADSCTACPAGQQCPLADGSGNTACEPGTYAEGAAAACTPCPAGAECPSLTVATVTPCPLGTFSVGAAQSCTPCPAGSECPETHTVATQRPCSPGSFSTGGLAACTPCPPGHFCTDVMLNDATQCAAGEFSLGSALTCTPCPAGHACPSKTQEGFPCEAGFYSQGGVTNCTECPAGSECSNAATVPQACPAGSWAPAGEIMCHPCTAGYQCPDGSATPTPAGSECPTGGYCPFPYGIYIPCPAGTVGTLTQAASEDSCTPCPPGEYCPTGSSTGIPCIAGHYCPRGTQWSSQFACPAGTYQDDPSTSADTQCKPCPPGNFCVEGTTAPVPCFAGSYCPANTKSSTEHLCPPGTYTASTGGQLPSDCTNCPPGSYCPAGSVAPINCFIGTYNAFYNGSVIADCRPCDARRSCPRTGMSDTEPCLEGHYCPEGTGNAWSFACPAGYLTVATNLASLQECTACPVSFACPAGTSGTNPPIPCALGHYCPAGTSSAQQYPCGPGTFGNVTDNYEHEQCHPCEAGKYCVEGSTASNGECPVGHYCPAGTKAQFQFPCGAGSYNPTPGSKSSAACLPCTGGHYCLEGVGTPAPCVPGTYRDTAGATALADCHETPGGRWSGSAATSFTLCNAGEYSPAGASSCSVCPAGYYCDATGISEAVLLATKECPLGMTCPEGFSTTPVLGTDFCPKGHYCPVGTRAPVPCPVGTYQDLTGQGDDSSCTPCTVGFYCLEGASVESGQCAAGYYCPVGSAGAEQEPCPAGTFVSTPQAESVDDCGLCTIGRYCPLATDVPLSCPLGFYCPANSSVPTPCPLGTYGNATNVEVVEGCSPCPGGKYCDTLGMSSPRGLCDPGYYCISNAYTSAPPGLPTGGECPPGGYCPAGSEVTQSCDAGTFNNFTGGRSAADCVLCTPGYYCAGSNNPFPTDMCDAGYYCDGGAQVPTQHTTPKGTYTPRGASSPVPCEAGKYQPLDGQTTCAPCPAGFVCYNESTITPTICPTRHYCEDGSATPTPCPAGTFSSATGLKNATSCEACTPGYYCFTSGLSSPTGLCDAGHVCTGGAELNSPVALPYGDICPAGHYCPEGTHTPQPCASGTYSMAQGASNSSVCQACPPGKYCSAAGMATNGVNCDAGYYCSGGSDTPTPSPPAGGLCVQTQYCPSGSSAPLYCDPGYHMNTTGKEACFGCPKGYYCGGLDVEPIPCDTGHYCPALSHTPVGCPEGTYSSATMLTDPAECTPCDGGSYCSGMGLTEPTGPCDGGYFCTSGVNQRQPAGAHTGAGGRCTPGHYCPLNSTSETLCPPGTFSASHGNHEAGDCTQCTAGSYCLGGESSPTALCQGGHFCALGSSSATPAGAQCGPGTYCPTGSSAALACPPGTHNAASGQTVCADCDVGSYCTGGAAVPASCEPGHYCPPRTVSASAFPCAPGFFNNATDSTSSGACLPCTAGHYCGLAGLPAPTGLCNAGYYCTGQSDTATPISGSGVGGRCEPGFYCPSGTTAPISCGGGEYCATAALGAPTGLCTAGYFCTSESFTAVPTDGTRGDICPPGSYCPTGSDAPIDCPQGTFSTGTRLGNESECTTCTPGFYCSLSGRTSPFDVCNARFYCPGGQTTPTPAGLECPAGNKCVAGTGTPVPCPAGEYQPSSHEEACLQCPSSKYCDTTTAYDCQPGYVCPPGTAYATQYPCPQGSFSNSSGRSFFPCTPCSGGYYCSGEALTSPTAPCSAGYYCTASAQTASPTDSITGDICPVGSYCPAGSSAPVLCPPGTLLPSLGATNESYCQPCPAGEYCQTAGLSFSSSGTCQAGYVCSGRSTLAIPLLGSGYTCPVGHACPAGTPLEIPCTPGYYQDTPGMATCKQCPKNSYCPNSTMSAHLPCPQGFYCPLGTSVPVGCPAGRYGHTTSLGAFDECALCPAGWYCGQVGLLAPQGTCSPGFFCNLGASVPNPNGLDPALPLNGMCPPGRWCANGTTSPTLCDTGTFNPNEGGDEIGDCLPCAPGFYCPNLGQTTCTHPCVLGFYCPDGLGSDVGFPLGYDCPKGHYCPAGSATPTPCPDGQYQDVKGKGSCKACTKGGYCVGNATAPVPCPPNYYCLASTTSPILCPAGSYSTATGLEKPEDCTECPPGKYCTAGIIQGNCTAGYLCSSSSGLAEPEVYGNIDAACRYRHETCGVDPTVGGLCPKGHYCPAGTEVAIKCPNATVRAELGGQGYSSCVPCPAGFVCVPGNPVPQRCPPGEYCELSKDPTPCPVGTYSPDTQAESVATCRDCEAGYWCKDLGTYNLTTYPCPQGAFCEQAVLTPTPCPPGHFRDRPFGASIADCLPCPGGTYCPGPQCPSGNTTVYTGTVHPSSCSAGMYCPEAASNETRCPGGYYCPLEAAAPTYCAPGTYCPSGSHEPILCPEGYFCEGGLAEAEKCPDGFVAKNTTAQQRVSLTSTCTMCPPGTYGNSRETLTACLPCYPGYVCWGATTSGMPHNSSQGGEVCPLGHYCPEGSGSPTQCPAGTFNPGGNSSAAEACRKCPKLTHNPLLGQSSCEPCGSSATSEEGAATCTCKGSHRAYQATDKHCICEPGYEYYDASLRLSDGDSTIDCQPIVYPRCTSGEVRRPTTGACLQPRDHSLCGEECRSGTGVLSRTHGICECDGIVGVDEICDLTCRRNAARFETRADLPGRLVITTANGSSTVELEGLGWKGKVECPKSDKTCAMVPVRMSAEGFLAVYDPPDDYISGFLVNGGVGRFSAGAGGRRLLVADAANGQLEGVDQPVVCIQAGDAVVFDVSEEGHYPVYDKDHLFNTESFDHGAFRDLADILRTNETVTVFAYTFVTKGVFVFKDAGSDRRTVIRVVSENELCPTEAPAVPLTSGNLVKVGIVRQSNLLLDPDWALIVGLFAALILLVCVLVATVYFFRHQSWTTKEVGQASYRKDALGEKRFDQFASKGSTVAKQQRHYQDVEGDTDWKAMENEFWDYERQIDLEGFSVDRLYEKLNDQSEAVNEKLDAHQKNVKDFYEQIKGENEELKAVIFSKLEGVAARGAGGGTRIITEDDHLMAEARASEAEVEIARRKDLGARYVDLLAEQKKIWGDDDDKRCEFELGQRTKEMEIASHQRTFEDQLSLALSSDPAEEGKEPQRAVVAVRLISACEDMHTALAGLAEAHEKERERRHVLPAPGCPLLGSNGKTVPLSELVDARGALTTTKYASKQNTSGLFVPTPGFRMLGRKGRPAAIPPMSCVHPENGHIVPIVGNTGVDCLSGRVVFTGGVGVDRFPRHVLPFIPCPVGVTGRSTLAADLNALAGSIIVAGGSFHDPVSGLYVPTMAATIDPSTQKVIPLGGAHVSPITGLLTPIQMGGLMSTGREGEEALIMGVAVDVATGKVVPVGGVANGEHVMLVRATKVAASGKQAQTTGATLTEGQPTPTAGGYVALLDAAECVLEDALHTELGQVVDECRAVAQTLAKGEAVSSDGKKGILAASSAANAKLKAVRTAREKNRSVRHRVLRHFVDAADRAALLASTGGQEGTTVDPVTHKAVPLFIGGKTYDMVSGLEVPVVGVTTDPTTNKVTPLAGTMVDPTTGDNVPIEVGQSMRDPTSGRVVPVGGATYDPVSKTTVPSPFSAVGGANPKPVVAQEIVARNSYERQERRAEAEIANLEGKAAEELRRLLSNQGNDPQAIAALLARIDVELKRARDASQSEEARRKAAQADLNMITDASIVRELTAHDKEEEAAMAENRNAHERYKSMLGDHLAEAAGLRASRARGDLTDEELALKLEALRRSYEAQEATVRAAVARNQARSDMKRGDAEMGRSEAQRLAAETERRQAESGSVAAAFAHANALPVGETADGMPVNIAQLLEQLAALGPGGIAAAGGGGGAAATGGGAPGGSRPGADAAADDPAASTKAVEEAMLAQLLSIDEECRGEEERDAARAGGKVDAEYQNRVEVARKAMEQAMRDDPERAEAAIKQFQEETERAESDRQTELQRQRDEIRAKLAMKRAKKKKALAQEGARQDPRAAALIREIVAEDMKADGDAEEDTAEAVEAMDAEQVKFVAAARERMAEALEHASTPGERKAILAEYQNEILRSKEEHDKERQRQREAIRQRKAARASKQQEEDQGYQRKKKSGATVGDVKEEAITLMKETEIAANAAEIEAAAEREELDRKEEEAKEKLLAEENEQMMSELVVNGVLTDEQRAELLGDFNAHAKDLHAAVEDEKSKQSAAMKEKIAKKKQARLDAMERKHAEERKAEREHADEAEAVDPAILRQRQQAELKALEMEMEKEVAVSLEQLRAKLLEEKERKLRQKQLEMVNELAEDGKIDEEMREVMLDQHRKHMEELEGTMDRERAAQRAAMQRKIQEKKRAKAARKRAAAGNKLGEATVLVSADGALVVEKADASAAIAEEVDLLAAEQARQAQELEERQAKERAAAEAEILREAAEADKREATRLEEEKQAALRDKQAEMQSRLEAQALNEEERASIMEEYKNAMRDAAGELDSEREKQRKAARAKREEKKRRKLMELEKRQERERAAQEQAQQEELEEIKAKRQEDAEKEALMDALQQTDATRHQELIRMVLEHRHQEEMEALAEGQKVALAGMLQDAMDALDEEHKAALEQLDAKEAQDVEELEGAKDTMENEDYDEARAALEAKYEADRGKLEDAHVMRKEKREAGVISQAQHDFMLQKFKKREAQYAQFAEMIQELSPEQALLTQEADAAAKRAQELASLKEKLEQESSSLEEEHRKERQRLLEEHENTQREEMERLREETEKAFEAEKQKAELKLKQMQEKRSTAAKEKRDALERDLAAKQKQGELGQREADKLRKEFAQQLARTENVVEAERKKQREKQRKKIEEKRARKLAAKGQALRADADHVAQAVEDKQAREKAELAGKHASEIKTAAKEEAAAPKPVEKLASAVPARASSGPFDSKPRAGGAASGVGGGGAGLSEADWDKLLDRLDEIETTVKDVGAAAAVGGSGTVYVDDRDAALSPSADVEPEPIESLTPTQWVVLRYGEFVADLLHKSCGHEVITIRPVAGLPPSTYERNAFRNSYMVEEEDGRATLFVRKERLASVGEFVTVVLHALSHRHCGSMSDDSSRAFNQHFYLALQTVCAELFFSRTKPSEVGASLQSMEAHGNLLEDAFRRVPGLKDRENVLGHLVDLRAEDEGDMNRFSNANMRARLETYRQAGVDQRLTSFLGDLETSVQSGKNSAVERALAELQKGKRTKTTSSDSGPVEVDAVSASLEAQIAAMADKIDSLTRQTLSNAKKKMALEKQMRELEERMERDPSKASEVQQEMEAVQSGLRGAAASQKTTETSMRKWKAELDSKRRELQGYQQRSEVERAKLSAERLKELHKS